MSKDPIPTQRKEVHLDNSVVDALNAMAASMKPPIKVKKLMEMILEEQATGRRNDDTEGGTPVVASNQMVVAERITIGEEPSMLELEIQRAAAKKHIRLVKLERKLASNIPSEQYREMMIKSRNPASIERENLTNQIKQLFPNLTSVIIGAGQMIEDMSMKVCDTHVILGDHLLEYMISYEYR